MAKNLDELRSELYTVFNSSTAKARACLDMTSWEAWRAGSELMQAAAMAAGSIAAIEREIRERDSQNNGFKGLKG